ncbi:hypothetical protein ACVJBD_000328 [Rhizobium mongolense]
MHAVPSDVSLFKRQKIEEEAAFFIGQPWGM